MVEDIFIHNITQIGYLTNLIVIPFATIILGRKTLKEKREIGRFNNIRVVILSIFITFSILVALEFLSNSSALNLTLLTEWFGGSFDGFSLYTFLIGTVATLGLTLITYANRFEILYYTSIFFYGGMTIFYIFTGFDFWLMPYIYFAGACSIIFLYLTAFRVKDNGALGLAIFFTIAFGTVLIEDVLITRFAVIAYDIFIIIFALGYFKPFKPEVLS